MNTAIEYVDRPGDAMTWGNTLLIVTSDHGNSYLRTVKPLGAGDLPSQTGVGPSSYPGGEVTFGSGSHTNELVRLYAKGAGVGHLNRYEGVWYPCTTIIDNTQLFHAMLDAVGLPKASPLKVVTDNATCVPGSRANRLQVETPMLKTGSARPGPVSGFQ